MEAAKSYREGLSKQERAQHFDKLKVICGKDLNELASLVFTAILPSISNPDIGYVQIVSPKKKKHMKSVSSYIHMWFEILFKSHIRKSTSV